MKVSRHQIRFVETSGKLPARLGGTVLAAPPVSSALPLPFAFFNFQSPLSNSLLPLPVLLPASLLRLAPTPSPGRGRGSQWLAGSAPASGTVRGTPPTTPTVLEQPFRRAIPRAGTAHRLLSPATDPATVSRCHPSPATDPSTESRRPPSRATDPSTVSRCPPSQAPKGPPDLDKPLLAVFSANRKLNERITTTLCIDA